MPVSPMKTLEVVQADPMYYLREAISYKYETGIYALELPKALIGFSCFLPDDQVPSTEEYKRKQAEEAEMSKFFEDFETKAFAKKES